MHSTYARRAPSAISEIVSMPFLGFQTSRNASPMFLLGSPWDRITQPCSSRATLLTSLTTSACSSSVRTVKFRMSQKPKKALTMEPGRFVASAVMAPVARLREITLAPASPNPSWRRRARLKRPLSIFFICGCRCMSHSRGSSGMSTILLILLAMLSRGRTIWCRTIPARLQERKKRTEETKTAVSALRPAASRADSLNSTWATQRDCRSSKSRRVTAMASGG
mmetsp:Transcript_9700/g.22090  ORF Transcript_9700/g.22090 Transcript_9700/m.22090 type:complete len:223 (-) Transcript_9700:1532-2200(-)